MKDVTPIKVRGKKRQRSSTVPSKSSSHEESLPPRKRILRREFNSPGSRSYTSSRVSSGQNTPQGTVPHVPLSRYVPSRIEQLPTEILEEIFLCALNISLPRCSPILGAKLASEHMYRSFGLAIFGFFKDQHNNLYTTDRRLYAFVDDHITKARNDALRCKWMTAAFFRSLRDERLRKERARLDEVYARHLEAHKVRRAKKDVRCVY